MTYALDTNIVSYILRENESIAMRESAAVKSRLAMEIARNNDIVIPPIVYYEIKRWLNTAGAEKKERMFKRLCADADMSIKQIELDTAALIYSDLKQRGKPTTDADILIASFCMVNEYTLVTNNTKHFVDIENLAYVNWIDNQADII